MAVPSSTTLFYTNFRVRPTPPPALGIDRGSDREDAFHMSVKAVTMLGVGNRIFQVGTFGIGEDGVPHPTRFHSKTGGESCLTSVEMRNVGSIGMFTPHLSGLMPASADEPAEEPLVAEVEARLPSSSLEPATVPSLNCSQFILRFGRTLSVQPQTQELIGFPAGALDALRDSRLYLKPINPVLNRVAIIARNPSTGQSSCNIYTFEDEWMTMRLEVQFPIGILDEIQVACSSLMQTPSGKWVLITYQEDPLRDKTLTATAHIWQGFLYTNRISFPGQDSMANMEAHQGPDGMIHVFPRVTKWPELMPGHMREVLVWTHYEKPTDVPHISGK